MQAPNQPGGPPLQPAQAPNAPPINAAANRARRRAAVAQRRQQTDAVLQQALAVLGQNGQNIDQLNGRQKRWFGEVQKDNVYNQVIPGAGYGYQRLYNASQDPNSQYYHMQSQMSGVAGQAPTWPEAATFMAQAPKMQQAPYVGEFTDPNLEALYRTPLKDLEQLAGQKVLVTIWKEHHQEIQQVYPGVTFNTLTPDQISFILTAYIFDDLHPRIRDAYHALEKASGVKDVRNKFFHLYNKYKDWTPTQVANKVLSKFIPGYTANVPTREEQQQQHTTTTSEATLRPLADVGGMTLPHSVIEEQKVDNTSLNAMGITPPYRPRVDIVPNATLNKYFFGNVDVGSVCTWLCPERYSSRLPTDQTVRTALSQGTFTQTFTTDANGNLGLYIWPWGITGNASGADCRYIMVTNAGFNPVSGAATTYTSVAGPLNPVAANISALRMIATSMRINTLPSYNTSQGMIQLSYFTDYPNDSVKADTPAIPQAQMASMVNYQVRNLKTFETREVTVPDAGVNLVFVPISGPQGYRVQSAQEEGWYVLITGAAASTAVISITTSYVLEYMPTIAALPLVALNYANPGPATLSFMNNLLRACDHVQWLLTEEAENLASEIESKGATDHDTLIDMIIGHVKKLPRRTRLTHAYNMPEVEFQLVSDVE